MRLTCVGRRCADGSSLMWIGRCDRCQLFRFGGLVLADMAVETESQNVELSSGKYDVPVIRYFQTAALSVGFELSAIQRRENEAFQTFSPKDPANETDHISSVQYYNNNWQSKQVW